jgi:pyruvate ferredoxin oxidoreductase alpha subunit
MIESTARKLLTGNAAAAWAARLGGADYIPAFPITPQTEIIETIARWIDRKELDARMTMFESEHSMLTAAGAAAATGVRTFTATSSQGLLYAMEMLYTVAGWRVPLVLVNVSRGVAAPITLEADHQDVLAARDTGFLQLHCATCQEVLDLTLIAFRLAEDARVRLPVLVNLDGFQLSFTREPVELPSASAAQGFVGEFRESGGEFRAGHPVSQAVAVLGGGPYSYFRYEAQLSMLRALGVFDEISAEFSAVIGRRYEAVECYRAEDAEIVFFLIGSLATKVKGAVDRLRESGFRAGMVRPRLLRPFPAEALRAVLAGKQAVAVIDQDLSLGSGGILHCELASALYGAAGAPAVLTSYVGGLGGRDIDFGELKAMFEETRAGVDCGKTPSPRLLYTRRELHEMRQLQLIAAATDEAARSP